MDVYQGVNLIKENLGGGSNATTALCEKDGKIFYRKSALGVDAKKLYEQAIWLKEHTGNLRLTKINHIIYKQKTQKQESVCMYDMPYINHTMTCFDYVHTNSSRKSWQLVKRVLTDIDSYLHQQKRVVVLENVIENYINKKVISNLEFIKQASMIQSISQFEQIYINGRPYRNLSYYEKFLSIDFLKQIFMNDRYSDIHGDFTIENIICVRGSKQDDYYLIDPNTGNIHNSPYLDYAKLLQSLHGGYEFLVRTQTIEISENKIVFPVAVSKIYLQLHKKVEKWLLKKFGKEGLRSIYFHEIIHWLRLLPYKIKHDGSRALLFYCGLLMVLNDIVNKYGN